MSQEYGGYIGKVLFADLDQSKFIAEELDDRLYEDFIGGYGLGARILYSRQKARVDALGPENILGFLTGPLTGTPAVTSGRWAVVGKSPLTETIGDANGGGFLGPAIKKAGYDAVFFRGCLKSPMYIVIDNGKPELKDASDLWGMDAIKTNKMLKEKEGKKAEIACIGQGGENLCLISGIVTGGSRIAARSGLGAVMGSKRLKALVVKGDREIPIKDNERANKLRKEYIQRAKDGVVYQSLFKFGTCNSTPGSILCGDAGVKNWSGVAEVDYLFDPSILGGERITKNQVKKYGCYRCPIACGHKIDISKNPYNKYLLQEARKPEYETLAVLGPLCLNGDPDSIIMMNHLCNIYGLDTLSVGGTLAFAMECYEKGIITRDDTGGIELTWGNSKEMIRIIEMMAKREGFGDVLADGSKRAADRIGKNAIEYAMQIQGQELPLHGARYSPGYASSWTMDATPGRHTKGGYAFVERYSKFLVGIEGIPQEFERYEYSGRGEWATKLHNIFHLIDCSGFCLLGFLGGLDFNSIPDFMNAIVGWNYTLADLYKVGERISNIRQSFNIREGLNPLDFKVPDRCLGKPPLTRGPLAGITVDADIQIREFLEASDWDTETGKPSKRKLVELGLEDVADDLYPI